MFLSGDDACRGSRKCCLCMMLHALDRSGMSASLSLSLSPPQSWDVCAADAVMKASGGGFSDIEGKHLWYPMEYDRCAQSQRQC